MKRNIGKYLVIAIFIIVFIGCTTTMYTYRMPLPKNLENQDIVAAAVSTLQDNGYSIMLANEKIGLVSTEYRGLTGNVNKAFQKAFGGYAETERMKITISVDKKSGIIKMNPVLETITEGMYGGAGAPSNKSLAEAQRNQVMKISEELAEKLGINSETIEIVTEEK